MLSVKILTMFAKIQNLKNKYTLNEAQIRYAFNNLFHEMLSLRFIFTACQNQYLLRLRDLFDSHLKRLSRHDGVRITLYNLFYHLERLRA